MEQAILFPVFAEEYLNMCKKSAAYKASLQNAVNHLQRFSDATQIPVFTNLGEQVIEDFAYYLQSQNLMVSTIKKAFIYHFAVINYGVNSINLHS